MTLGACSLFDPEHVMVGNDLGDGSQTGPDEDPNGKAGNTSGTGGTSTENQGGESNGGETAARRRPSSSRSVKRTPVRSEPTAR